MTKKELKKKLIRNPGYLKSGAPKVASLFNVDYELAKKAIDEAKQELEPLVTRPEKLHSSVANLDLNTQNRELFTEFLRWKDNREPMSPETKKSLPKPFVGGDPNNVLVIGDLHEPFCLDDYLDFCREKQEKFNCGTVIFIGDVIDNHYSSYHESESDTYGPNEEFDRAKTRLSRWVAVFPEAVVTLGNHDRMVHRKAKTAGVADRWIKNYSEALGAPKWNFVDEIQVCGVNYNHGEGGTARQRMKNECMSQVQGHLHNQAYVEYSVGQRHRIFGMQVGCGIDRTAFAFAYGKNHKKPVISCGVILNGKLPILLPMEL